MICNFSALTRGVIKLSIDWLRSRYTLVIGGFRSKKIKMGEGSRERRRKEGGGEVMTVRIGT